ncbi:MAG: BatA domain-containing protein, partial [Gemmatimonadaceae bacterium]
MTWLAPIFLAAGAVAAFATAVLHFLARRRPHEVPLPTARFLPERAAEAATRSARPSDLLLLAVRVLAVLLAAAAFARPLLRGARRPVARVVLADVSRDVRARAEMRDSVRALAAAGDVVIAFDSAARVMTPDALDSLGSTPPAAAGSVSAALVAARRSVALLRDRADSVEMVIVSPLAADEVDAATARIRATWNGRARLVRVAAANADSAARRVELRAAANDPLGATIALAGGFAFADVRIARDVVTAADSAWARAAA